MKKDHNKIEETEHILIIKDEEIKEEIFETEETEKVFMIEEEKGRVNV